MNNLNEIKQHFEEEAESYDNIIPQIIPYYTDMVDAIVAAIPYHNDHPIQVLDLGCGTGNVSKAVQSLFRHAEFSLVDISKNMIEAAKAKIGQAAVNQGQTQNFEHYQWEQNFDIILSSLALHHLFPDEAKRRFYRGVYRNLNPGGAFIIADVVLACDEKLQSIYMQKWTEYMKRSFSDDEIRNKWLVKYRKEDRPAKLSSQLFWLKDIGFSRAEVIWKYYNFAVFAGYKD